MTDKELRFAAASQIFSCDQSEIQDQLDRLETLHCLPEDFHVIDGYEGKSGAEIDLEIDLITDVLREVRDTTLERAKAFLIEEAIQGELPSDFNQLSFYNLKVTKY